ncbi:outer membrane protein [Breoghania corrubedonensis]|uniref:Outer membrane protein n=1 Tax=Breoghania corrubedonensis TaxID=665038 RepID=A0A2T5V9F1_9HYPH|nr:TolC family outer membrane protein [Breoghania corrubedonensis]PTW60382.1 outer membrane protein [Breoghania corrubedonensis]
MTIRSSVVALATASTVLFMAANVQAQSISDALAMAYSNNPSLNAARAQLRATDESVSQALSGWRPQIFANLSAQHTTFSSRPGGELYYNTATVGLQIQQSIFRGFRTVNSTRQAESLVKAQRASLRSTEQNVLLSAAQSYMNVIRDTAIVSLNRSNIKFLGEQVRAAKDRFEVGEGTRTDIAQADARLAAAQSQLNLARANLNADRAVFRQVVGVEPGRIVPRTNIRAMLPHDLKSALSQGAGHHPDIIASQFNIDAAQYNVKVLEGNMLPTVTVEGNVGRSWNPSSTSNLDYTDSASVVGRVSVPLYQGGLVSSQVRQAKEELGSARILLDSARDSVRASIVAAWGSYQAAEASVNAGRAQVDAAQLALNGVIEEQRVGQQTTLDVLNAQNELIDAKSTLVTAQRDSVVAAFSLVAAVGRLTADDLNLRVVAYRPREHYEAVRDKWFGLRTPDGR